MTTVRVRFAAPATREVETDGATWLVDATTPGALVRAIREGEDVAATMRALPADDAVVARVDPDGTLDAYRSVTATRVLYLVDREDDPALLTDNFRSALAAVPVAERSVPRRAIADHLLFRSPIEPTTYVSQVRALPHGTWLHRDGATGAVSTRQVGRVTAATERSRGQAVDALEGSLAAVLAESVPDRAATMLSGGTDSTLLHTFRADDPAFVMTCDSPEVGFEYENAARASDALGVTPRRVRLDEDSFLTALEASIDALGSPSHYHQTVLTNHALRRDGGDWYVNGAGADSLFGVPSVKAAKLAGLLSPLLAVPGAKPLCRHGLGQLSAIPRRLCDLVQRLDRPLGDPRSLAVDLAFFTDPSLVARMTDRDTVTDRVDRQVEYVRERAAHTGESRFARHAECGHWLSFFQHDGVSQWRQLGHVHDSSLVTPFTTARVARTALSVAPEDRFVGPLGDMRPKHVPKALLERRLPAYSPGNRKGSGSLPVARYFADGPLGAVFDRYDPPGFVPPSLTDRHVDRFGPVTWNLLTFAVWRDRVLRDPALDPVPAVAVVRG
ncbi:asparagine synthase-related protein [Haloarchaeobius amylolyticus]|uniref:asparagine synthase-related protein n=1 Tax=Haloarchaeobius amylolyticus TaxID=1198296 RepID=UPI00226E6646